MGGWEERESHTSLNLKARRQEVKLLTGLGLLEDTPRIFQNELQRSQALNTLESVTAVEGVSCAVRMHRICHHAACSGSGEGT